MSSATMVAEPGTADLALRHVSTVPPCISMALSVFDSSHSHRFNNFVQSSLWKQAGVVLRSSQARHRVDTR